MYIDTILHHHIRRCPYNIISIMIGLFQCFEYDVGGIDRCMQPQIEVHRYEITFYSLQLNEIHCNKRHRRCNVWIGVVYGLGTIK